MLSGDLENSMSHGVCTLSTAVPEAQLHVSKQPKESADTWKILINKVYELLLQRTLAMGESL